MSIQFVCPSCHGQLINKSQKNNEDRYHYVCSHCQTKYSVRDKTPVLIYPQPDTKLLEIMYSGGSTKRRKSFFKRALDLFIYKIKVVGLYTAIIMVPTYIWAKIYNKFIILLSTSLSSQKVECSCCGWQGIKFGVFWGTSKRIYNFACPACGSHPRHRMLSLYIPQWIDINSSKILHFAPEEFLEPVFASAQNGDLRVTTDITLSGVSCLSNINNLPFNENSFKHIICIHVLEHIEDDSRAMRELNRVLSTDGLSVICIPESNFEKTVEFGFEDPTKSHHWRDYGKDVSQKLAKAGFNVNTVTPQSLNAAYDKFGLSKKERFHLCTKKNNG